MTGALPHTLHVPHYLSAGSLVSPSFLHPLVTPPFPVILKTPIDSVLRLSTTSTTMTSADFCAFSIALRQWLLLSERTAQTSPGTTRLFPSIHLPHLPCIIPCSYWASTCDAVLPPCIASYVISVRQTRGLPVGLVFSPTSGFLQIPPHDRHPCLRLYPSHCRADSGLSPVRNVRRRAHINIRSENTAVSGPYIFLC